MNDLHSSAVLDPRRPAGLAGGAPLGQRARSDAAVRQAAAAALWLSLLLVTFWWVTGRGVQDLGGWASGLTSVGRVSGLTGAVLLLAQVVLMARVPLVERAFGQDRLARLHRVVGFTSFTLVLVHVVTITWGYAAGALGQFLGMLWTLTVSYPGMLLAAAGTVCLFLVVGTSLRRARLRLRYESWHLLHLYAYLGVGLALPHQLWTGQQFTGSPARTVFWWSAWALAAGAVLTWRVGLPVCRNLRHRLRVASVVREAEDVVSVHLTGRRLDLLRVEAGQFFTWRFLGRPGWTRAHPYSVSAAPDGQSLRITVRAVGTGSSVPFSVRPGTPVLVEGPYGRLSARARSRRRVALIGAGVGITPLRALAEELHYDPGEAVLLQRCTVDPLFPQELEALTRERGLEVLILPGHRRSPHSWLGAGVGPMDQVDDLWALRWWVPDIAERDVYLCGPPPWVALVQRTLAAAGLPADRLHLETFTW
ncbi:MAG TPA: ferredoxin reductase family protein [Segeticoccus sp.]|uniref:ferredoxin reductase family protein n=1 Tax=Segeticoccus sp. TaxID=2706531 RepID=UPI002D7FFCF0|nr:ferredoxin reductase family protein [Segeticoccus sp.]HET8601601.1 ferredoxin reductase family protein [Segeticoccus sp.]